MICFLCSLDCFITEPSICFSFAFGVLRRFLPEEKVESVKGLALTADGKGAVFDVSVEDLDTFLAGMFSSVFGLRFF